MAGETLFVFLILFVTIILFVSDRLRLDVVAILVILALMLSGLLSSNEALAGFGDPVVIRPIGVDHRNCLYGVLGPKTAPSRDQ